MWFNNSRDRDQIEVFKILNGYENIDRNMFFSLKKDTVTCHLGLWLGWQILLNLVKYHKMRQYSDRTHLQSYHVKSTVLISLITYQDLISLPSKAIAQLASGQGSHWLIESPTIFHLCVIRPPEIFIDFIFKHVHYHIIL